MPATVEREKELIARIIAGDTNLFHELIRPYERMVYLSILTMLRNEQEAEDASQEVMINAFRHLKSFRGDAKFSTWLVTIAMNEARQRLRKAKAAQLESLDESKEDREAASHLPRGSGPSGPGGTQPGRNGKRAGHQCYAGESAVAPGAHDAAKNARPLSACGGSGKEGFLREDVSMTLECKHVWERISEYLDHQLDPELLMDIEKHLENCEVCSAILDSTRNILVLTADNRTYELPVGYSERLHARLEKVIRQTGKPKNDSA